MRNGRVVTPRSRRDRDCRSHGLAGYRDEYLVPRDLGLPHAWQLWEIPWQPPGPGSYTLRARATDVTEPATVPFNTREYLFDGIVDHHVTVT
jgi:hypothetical protein